MGTVQFDEKDFVRQKVLEGKSSLVGRYMEMTSGKVSLRRFAAYELITTLFGPMPGAAGYFLRKLFYPQLFAKIGSGAIFGRNITIRNPGNILIGDRVVIDDYAVIDGRGATEAPLMIGSDTIIGRAAIIQCKVGAISIGSNCNIGTGTVLTSQGGIRIGKWVQIAGGCKISGGLFKPKNEAANSDAFPFQRYSKGPIIIEDMCFIGGSVQVTDGVTIGTGSMIGAGSVIMSNIPEKSIFIPKPGMIVGKTI
jgi:acetyltransferase-like isoleucine patch superfamily enzyme